MSAYHFRRAVRARGLSEWVVVNLHVLRNSMIPVITIIGLEFGHLLGVL